MRGPCRTCDHWRSLDKRIKEQKSCTKNPPTTHIFPRPGPLAGQLEVEIRAICPPTRADHECGCWEPKIELPNGK